MTTEHPARVASQRSMEIVGRKGENARSQWLALFADGAIVEDPIGASPLDPEGVFTYKVDAEGKILSLRAFWELEQMVVKMKKP